MHRNFCYIPPSLVALSIVSLISISTVLAETTIHRNNESGLITYGSEQDGFSIELIQLLPDFVRAIYAKHDFPKNEVERIANYCVFGTIIKNTSRHTLSYDVSSWHYRYAGDIHTVKTKTEWLDEWRKVGIIFSWTLLPDAGTFEVGDWQQGFTTILAPRDAKFDLIVKWQLDENGKNVSYSNRIKDVACPPQTITGK